MDMGLRTDWANAKQTDGDWPLRFGSDAAWMWP